MSANLARTADGWWLVTPAGLIRLGLTAPTTAALLAGRPALDTAVETARLAAAANPHEAVPAGSLDLFSPVTAPARIVAQMVNYRSHAIDSGMNPDTVPPAFFRKTSHSLTGPAGDVIRPHGVSFLDYEVELGLVIGADMPVGTVVTDATLDRYVAALVVANDISARQVQLVKTQFYEAKSYPTFTPAGPWLTLADAADLARLSSLRLTLSVNGEMRQDAFAADMIVRARRGADPAVPLPAAGAGGPAADRHARRDRPQGPRQGSGGTGRAAAARHPVAAVLPPPGRQPPLPARRRRHHRRHRHPRRPARPRHPAQHHHREDAMTTKEILPLPESTYQLLLDAARAWPDAVATQWIPDPAAYTSCLTRTYADLAGTVTQIANGLASLGVRRPDAVTLCGPNSSMLFAATLAAQAPPSGSPRPGPSASTRLPRSRSPRWASSSSPRWPPTPPSAS